MAISATLCSMSMARPGGPTLTSAPTGEQSLARVKTRATLVIVLRYRVLKTEPIAGTQQDGEGGGRGGAGGPQG